jgi:hypothetical protein
MGSARNLRFVQWRWAWHAIGLAVLALTALVAWRVSETLSNEQAQLQQEQQAIAGFLLHEDSIRARHARLGSEVRAVREQGKGRGDHITSLPNEAAFLAQLSQLARNVDVSIKDFHPGPSASTGKEVQVSVVGSFPSMCRLLDGLETVSPPCEVVQCALVAPGRVGESGSLELKMRLPSPTPILHRVASAATRP